MTSQTIEDARTLGEEAYHLLRADILAGRLEPDEKLPFRQLSSRYGIGIAPLREALSRLASERLVAFEGLRGFVVAPISRAELDDLCSLRIELTSMAFRRAIEKGDYDWEDEILLSVRALTRTERSEGAQSDAWLDQWEKRHDRFHSALIAACGSEWLKHFCTTLSDQYQRYRRLVVQAMAASDGTWADVRDQHQVIADAALARDADRAVACLADHFRHSRGIVDSLFETREKRDAAPKAEPGQPLKPAAK